MVGKQAGRLLDSETLPARAEPWPKASYIFLESVCDLMLSLEILCGLSPIFCVERPEMGGLEKGSAVFLSSLPRTRWDHNHTVKRKEIGNFPKENVLSI